MPAPTIFILFKINSVKNFLGVTTLQAGVPTPMAVFNSGLLRAPRLLPKLLQTGCCF